MQTRFSKTDAGPTANGRTPTPSPSALTAVPGFSRRSNFYRMLLKILGATWTTNIFGPTSHAQMGTARQLVGKRSCSSSATTTTPPTNSTCLAKRTQTHRTTFGVAPTPTTLRQLQLQRLHLPLPLVGTGMMGRYTVHQTLEDMQSSEVKNGTTRARTKSLSGMQMYLLMNVLPFVRTILIVVILAFKIQHATVSQHQRKRLPTKSGTRM